MLTPFVLVRTSHVGDVASQWHTVFQIINRRNLCHLESRPAIHSSTIMSLLHRYHTTSAPRYTTFVGSILLDQRFTARCAQCRCSPTAGFPVPGQPVVGPGWHWHWHLAGFAGQARRITNSDPDLHVEIFRLYFCVSLSVHFLLCNSEPTAESLTLG